MTTQLGPFPVDDTTLDLIDEALDTTISGWDDEGNPIRDGEFSFGQVLDFLSGYDPALCVPVLNEYDTEIPDVVEYTGTRYCQADVIRALIAEVRRLRA